MAITYTSAAPVIDPLNPPPFAIPGGSGLAWALPLNTISYNDSPADSNGGSVSTAATPASGYELMSYAVATLTAANQYTLKATGTGNHLNRAIYGAPPLGGTAHATGDRFAFLDPASRTGQLHVDIPAQWIGKTLFFKFLSFNTFGTALQSLGDVQAYSYTIAVIPGGGSGVQLFQVNGA